MDDANVMKDSVILQAMEFLLIWTFTTAGDYRLMELNY